MDFVKTRKAGDLYDADISESEPTMLLIAIGSLTKPGLNRNSLYPTNFHSSENESIVFNSQQQEKCYEAPSKEPDPKEKWRVPFRLKRSTTTFEARLGPPGGDKGYRAITGQDPPFIG